MKLTKNQIQELFVFVRKHYVEQYDLQMELVDHLADGIEAQWLENPKMSFEEARQKEFKKFGVFGFMNVVEERQKALSKKYYRIIFKFFKRYFQLPQIIVTLCLTILLVMILQRADPGHMHYWISGILLLGITPMFFSMRVHSKKLKKKNRKWLLEEMILNQAGMFQILTMPIHLFNFEYTITSMLALFLISFCTVSLLLLIFVITYVIPSKVEELLSETYPEYKLV